MTIKNDLELRLPEPFKDFAAFIKHWAELYEMQNKNVEHFYEKNINKEPTEHTIELLYIWKNGGTFFYPKQKQGIEDRYKKALRDYLKKPPTHKRLNDMYLNYKDDKSGGMIWNIFYLHIISKNEKLNEKLKCAYPIFDQHVYRAMCFMKSRNLRELETQTRKQVFIEYKDYIRFYKYIEKEIGTCFEGTDPYGRKIDRALFLFGKSIKENKPFKSTYPKTKK